MVNKAEFYIFIFHFLNTLKPAKIELSYFIMRMENFLVLFGVVKISDGICCSFICKSEDIENFFNKFR